MTARLLPQAEADIESIAFHIARDNPSAAHKWLDDIRIRCEQLGLMPGMGVARFDLRPDLRMFPFGRYLILYRQSEESVEIVRVIHGARQWQGLL